MSEVTGTTTTYNQTDALMEIAEAIAVLARAGTANIYAGGGFKANVADGLLYLAEAISDATNKDAVKDRSRALAQILDYYFVSPNEADSNLESANVVDGLFFIGRAINRLAAAIEKEPEREKEDGCGK